VIKEILANSMSNIGCKKNGNVVCCWWVGGSSSRRRSDLRSILVEIAATARRLLRILTGCTVPNLDFSCPVLFKKSVVAGGLDEDCAMRGGGGGGDFLVIIARCYRTPDVRVLPCIAVLC